MPETFSVLIPDGEGAVALYAAYCLAQSRRVKLYILSNKRWSWCRFSRCRGSYEFKPMITDCEERFNATVDIIKRFNIDVVLPVHSEGIGLVAAKYQALSKLAALPPIPDLRTLEIARNKWLVNQLACEQHVSVPPSILATLDSAFYEQLSSLEYPVLLKPNRGAGGQGIRRFDTQFDLQIFLEEQDQDQFKNRYHVQSYVPGPILGLNVLCRKGEILASTIQQCLTSHHFGPPLALQFIEQEDVLENGRKLLSALNWSGYANIDMKYDTRNGQVKVIEVNPRFWATLLGSLIVGVNFPYLSCLEALDIPFPVPQYRLGKYVRTGTAIKEGILRLVRRSNLDEFAFQETDLRFALVDPLPELVNLVARGLLHSRDKGLAPSKVLKSLDGFLADWFPEDSPQ